MKHSLQIDRLQFQALLEEILAKIALHYPEVEREAIWEKVQRQYGLSLRLAHRLKRNFHNGVGGTYDCHELLCGLQSLHSVKSKRWRKI